MGAGAYTAGTAFAVTLFGTNVFCRATFETLVNVYMIINILCFKFL